MLERAPRENAGRVDGPVSSGLSHRGWKRLVFVVDAVMLLIAFGFAYSERPYGDLSTIGTVGAISFVPAALAVLAFRGAYRTRLSTEWFTTVVGALSLVAMALIAMAVIPDSRPGRSIPVIVTQWLLSILLVTFSRTALGALRRRLRNGLVMRAPTLIIGAGSVGRQIADRLEQYPQVGLVPVGFLDSSRATARLPVLGTLDDFERVVVEHRIEHLIVAFSGYGDEGLVPLVDRASELGLEISVVPRLFDTMNTRIRIDRLGSLPLLAVNITNPKGWQFAVKHALDRVLALTAIVVLSPLMIAVAIAIRLTSPGPVLFRQPRAGRYSEPFEMLKFRTMRMGPSEGAMPQLTPGIAPGGVEGRDRRTPVGRFLRRFALDELPQFFNVLKGDMSLVGPRPERVHLARLFADDVQRYAERHRVKTGMTGWAQVHNLRGQTSLADRADWDNYYIRNWSLWLDLRIVLMTVIAVLRDHAQ